jgi:hypothetical protein
MSSWEADRELLSGNVARASIEDLTEGRFRPCCSIRHRLRRDEGRPDPRASRSWTSQDSEERAGGADPGGGGAPVPQEQFEEALMPYIGPRVAREHASWSLMERGLISA